MIRPGINDPRVGAMRTQQMRQKLGAMLKRSQAPRMGGMARRPVAGPGVRQFGGQGPLHPSALSALVNRLNNSVIPMQGPVGGLPPQAQAAHLDTLPDPASGQGAEHAFGQLGVGPGASVGYVGGQLQGLIGGSQQPEYLGEQAQSLLGGGLGPSAPVGNLIPLGGGNYYDTSTGTMHGPGGVQAF